MTPRAAIDRAGSLIAVTLALATLGAATAIGSKPVYPQALFGDASVRAVVQQQQHGAETTSPLGARRAVVSAAHRGRPAAAAEGIALPAAAAAAVSVARGQGKVRRRIAQAFDAVGAQPLADATPLRPRAVRTLRVPAVSQRRGEP